MAPLVPKAIPATRATDALELGHTSLREIYAALCLTRSAEERLEVLHKQGHVTGGVYRSLGQEAGAVGAAYALRRATDGTGDFIAPTVRAAGALFLFGGERPGDRPDEGQGSQCALG